jgi:NADH-quinone oxidoreductase subunit J
MSGILFYLIAILAILTALGMIFGRNATRSVLLMVANFAMVGVLYLMLNAPFLAAVQVLVYAGAILILFLFVVMLMGNDPGPLWEQIPFQRPLALLFAVVMIGGLAPVVAVSNITAPRGQPLSDDPVVLAEALYSNFALPFEITSVILLIAIIGTIVLAKRDAYRTRREEVLHLDEEAHP